MSLLKMTASCLAVASVLISSAAVADDGFSYEGYFRAGLHYENDGNDYVAAQGQLAGNAVGRLGNEHNGAEILFRKRLDGAAGTKWEAAVMIDAWGRNPGSVFTTDSAGNLQEDKMGNSDVNLRQSFVGVSNVFESQPDLYIWIGRTFHQRPNAGLSDYMWMFHDGQGAGFKHMKLGGVELDLAFMAQSDGRNGTGEDDNGNYAITSKLSGIDLFSGITMDIQAAYGFTDDSPKGKALNADKQLVDITEKLDDAFQIATVFNCADKEVVVRYAENADNIIYNKTNDLTTLYAHLRGTLGFGEQASMDYLFAYHDNDAAARADDRSNVSVVLRPMYEWSDIHSTWLEAGYSLVDYDAGEENTAWKLTLSQNLSLSENYGRPQLRFYATAGEADNETSDIKTDTFAIGAMVEAWW